MPAAAWVPAVAGVAGSIIGGKSKNETIRGLAPSLLQAGLGVTGSLLTRGSQEDAMEAQLEAQREALAFEREKEEERRRQFAARERALSPYRLGGYSVLAKYFGPEAVEGSMAEDPETPEMRAARALDEVSRSRTNPYSLENLATRRPYGL